MVHGTLDIRVVECTNLRDTELFGKMDPYVQARVDSQCLKTKVKNGAGKNPTFNETLTFTVIDQSVAVTFDVLDSDTGKDDHIGTCTIPLNEAFRVGTHDCTVDLVTRKTGKKAGQIHVVLYFKPRDNMIQNMAAVGGLPHGQMMQGSAPYGGYPPVSGYGAPAQPFVGGMPQVFQNQGYPPQQLGQQYYQPPPQGQQYQGQLPQAQYQGQQQYPQQPGQYPPTQGQQYQQQPGNYPPPQGQQYSQQPGNYPPLQGQQYNQPPQGQQYNQPPQGQQYNQPQFPPQSGTKFPGNKN